ncbi:MAG: putative 4-hydroxybenzoate polyprenyltransferase [Planctomycetaceae bacterium]|nr:putative 4-hydroxybenzoate polyprenyltransferase [Planctomycetaceae bacterium]
MKTLVHLLGLIRFSHTVFALPFALLAAAMAWSRPDSSFEWRQLAGVLLCMVFARSAAMAFNRLVDRDIDAANPRTQSRHLPAGILSVPTVWAFTVLCGVGFVASTLLFLPNWWPLVLSGPVLAFLCGYSYAKRFTAWCHYWLAAALMLSPIAAWLAIRGVVELPPVLLAGVIFFWVGGFDILYACQDADFDRERRLNSLPARLGVAGALRMAFVSHLLAIGGMFAVWAYGDFGPIFLTGVIGVSVLLLLEHSLVRADNLSRVNLAFFHMNAVISLGLLAVGLLDLWWQ